MRRASVAGFMLVLAVLTGCSGAFTKVAPAPPAAYATTAEAEGTGCGTLLFNAIPIGVNDRVERAYRQAVNSVAANGLTNTQIVDRWYWIYVGTLICTDVSGVGFTAAAE